MIFLQFLKEMEEIVEPTSPAQTRANTRIHSRAHSRAHSRTHTGSGSFANFRAHSRTHTGSGSFGNFPRAHSRTQTGNASFTNFSIPTVPTERQPLLARATESLENHEESLLGPVDRNRPVAGGTVLGIHNLAIVFPQFIVCHFPLFKPLPLSGSGVTQRMIGRFRSLVASSSRLSMGVNRTTGRHITAGMALRGS